MKNKLNVFLGASAVGALSLLWIGLPLFVRHHAKDWAESGSIGDTFNIASSLFTALALLGVIYTLQRQVQDANARDIEMRNQKIASDRQIFHLSLATKLQTIQTLIEENRRALVELRPRIDIVPRASSRLMALRSEIIAELTRDGNDQQGEETLDLVDSLIGLQKELNSIRKQLDDAIPQERN